MWARIVLGAAFLAAALASRACEIGYYGHLLYGQYQLVADRVPIDQVLADAKADPALQRRLRIVQQARQYASKTLALPDNGSYTGYTDLHRRYAVWNVFAAPEFSLKPHEWCFLVVGCLGYRGYFDEAQAHATADEFKGQGEDVYVAGIAAYSTLGWFDDPVLNTMLAWPDDVLIGTIFHELGHQQLYVKGDTAFNESFATFVEEQGLRQYLPAGPDTDKVWQRRARDRQFVALMLEARKRLDALYKAGGAPDALRAAKAQEFARLQSGYESLKAGWGGDGRYDAWFKQPLNNARLLPFGLYYQWVPAFAGLYAEAKGDWKAFYAAAKTVGDLDPPQREVRLKELAKNP